MKAIHHAVNEVYGILKQVGALACPVYKYTKPTGISPIEYIVINAINITAGVLQNSIVNVNFYRKDIANGIPDIERLEVISTQILDYLTITSNRPLGIYIDFERQEIIASPETGEHYSNFRLKVKLINK